MTTQEYLVEGMTCEHCVRAVTSEIEGIDGVLDVRVDLVPGAASTVRVESTSPLSPSDVALAVDEAGYMLAPISAAPPQTSR